MRNAVVMKESSGMMLELVDSSFEVVDSSLKLVGSSFGVVDSSLKLAGRPFGVVGSSLEYWVA